MRFPLLQGSSRVDRGQALLSPPVQTPQWPFTGWKERRHICDSDPNSYLPCEPGRSASPPVLPRLWSGPALAFLWGAPSGVRLLGHMANLRLPFQNRPNCFPKQLRRFAFRQRRGRTPAARRPHQHLLGSVCLVIAVPVGVNGPPAASACSPLPLTGDAGASRFMSRVPSL